jgi:hypothetical protein
MKETSTKIKELYPNINSELKEIKPKRLSTFNFKFGGEEFRVKNPDQPIENQKKPVERMSDRLKNLLSKNRVSALMERYHIHEDKIPNNSIQLLIFNEEDLGNHISAQEAKKMIINRQKLSLKSWTNWVETSNYPDWFKYKVTRSVVNSDIFGSKRREDSTSEYLQFDTNIIKTIFAEYNGTKDINFVKRYRELQGNKVFESNETTKGIWKEFDLSEKGIAELSNSTLGANWCTQYPQNLEAFKSKDASAKFFVYFTEDENKLLTVPSLCIRIEKNSVAEVCGREPNPKGTQQKVPAHLVDIAFEKAKNLGGGNDIIEKYESSKMLENLFRKITKNPNCEVSKEELTFLYEAEKPIQTMGQSPHNYKKIKFLKDMRLDSCRRDWATIKSYKIEEVAEIPSQISSETKFVTNENIYSDANTPLWFLEKYISQLNFEDYSNINLIKFRLIIKNPNTPEPTLLKLLESTDELNHCFCENNSNPNVFKKLIQKIDFVKNGSLIFSFLKNKNINGQDINTIYIKSERDYFNRNLYIENSNTPENVLFDLLFQYCNDENCQNKGIDEIDLLNHPNCSVRIAKLIEDHIKNKGEYQYSDEWKEKIHKALERFNNNNNTSQTKSE